MSWPKAAETIAAATRARKCAEELAAATDDSVAAGSAFSLGYAHAVGHHLGAHRDAARTHTLG
jgi:hypothetical protein